MTEQNMHEDDGAGGREAEDDGATQAPAEQTAPLEDASPPEDASLPKGASPAENDASLEGDSSLEVVTVADGQDRSSADSLAVLTMPQPTVTSPVPRVPDRQPTIAPSNSLPPTGVPAVPDDEPAGSVSERRVRPAGPEPASSLTSDRLIEKTAAPPIGGWRRWVFRMTLGYVNLGDTDRVRIQRALEHRIATRLGDRTRYVPVLSRKGGVGKTTVTTLLGMALAGLREDRVIALDANPDRGTLSDRNPGRTSFTARNLVKDRFSVDSFAQLSSYTAREGSRLDVLASDADPMVADAFDDADYRAVTEILGRYYSIVLTDSGTGMVHSVMKGTLDKADVVVLVSGGSVDEARLASETLSWLEAHGRDDLVKKAIVVVNMAAGDGTRVDIDEIEGHFRTRVQHVIRIPHDRHLAEGSQIEFGKLRPATRQAAIELAALVVDGLVG